MSRSKVRKAGGSGIVEAAAGIALIVMCTVLAVLLLLNVGGASYHKEKLAFVAQQAADFASTLPSDSTREGLVLTMVDELLDSMGLNSTSSDVDVADLMVGSKPAVKVTVTTSLPTLLAGGFSSILPTQIRMSDSAITVKNSWFWGYGVGVLPTGQKLTFPMINPTGALPSDSLPAYTISIAGMWKIR